MLAKIITNEEEFYKLKGDWEKLQDQDMDVTYYSTFEYIRTWWDVYKRDKKISLFIICIYNDNDLVGIGPFMIEKHNRNLISYNILKFLGRGDYLGIIIDRTNNIKNLSIINDIFNVMQNNNKLFHKISLTNISHKSSLAFFLLKNSKYNSHFKYLIECPLIEYKKFKSFKEFDLKFVNSSARKSPNKLKREVGYSFIVVNNKNDFNVYNEISNLHIKEQYFLCHEKGKNNRTSLFENKNYSEFVRKIYKDNENVITFIIKDKNENIIVYNTCYFYKGILHSWNTAFDPQYEKYHLGKIINLEIHKYAIENNMADIFDFGTGRYPWKYEWTNDFNIVYQLDVWNLENRKAKLLSFLGRIRRLYREFKLIQE